MYIHTTEAAKLLNIPPRRLLDLLQKGRVVGAYKSGHCWIIPLYDGLPKIVPGKRGRSGNWNTPKAEKKRSQGLKRTLIHVNSNHIKQNAQKSAKVRKPVIVMRGKTNVYAHSLEIPYPCRIVYKPDEPLDCGAKVWIEVLGFDLAAMQPPANIVSSYG